MLGTLDRYLLGQVLRPMLAAILITLLALLAERALRVVDLVIGWRGSLAIVFEMLSYLVPHYMVVALPAAFFLGIMLAIGRLSREGELDAMRAAGIGLARIARPLLLLAIGVTALHFILVSHLQPFSRYAYRAAAFAVTNASFQTLLRPKQFITLGRNTYRVEALEAEGERFEGIFLYSEENEAGTVTVTAASGEIESRGALVPLVLHLQNGVQQFVPRATGAADGTERNGTPPPPLTLRFGNFTSDLSGTEPQPFRPRGENERELTIPELFGFLSAPPEALPEEIDPWEIDSELSARLVRNLTILVLPFFALPLALSPRRAKRSYGLLVGIVLLVGYNQLVNTGEALADDNKLSVWLSLWLPFLCFVALSVGYFVRTARRVPDPGRSSLLGATIDGLVSAFLRRLPWRAA
ncbi:MAG: LptF/LptG family permease [Geminicoccaceae bacterium]